MIRMRVTESDQARQKSEADAAQEKSKRDETRGKATDTFAGADGNEESDESEGPDQSTLDQHWSFGSSLKWTTSKALEDKMKGNRVYARFDAKIRRFLAAELPAQKFGDTIMVSFPLAVRRPFRAPIICRFAPIAAYT